MIWMLRLAPVALLLAALGWERYEANHWHGLYNDAMVAAHSAAVAQARAHTLSQEVANVSHVPYYNDAANAAARYAGAHDAGRVCVSSGSSLPGADSASAQHDRPGEAPDMVAVTRADFDLLTADATRLAEVQADAQALIDAGVAVTAP